MKALILCLIILFRLDANADQLLIPEKSVIFSSYKETCEKSGYICTHHFIAQKLQESATPLFDQLIENLDLSDTTHLSQIEKEVKSIIEYEFISLDQLETLIGLTEKTFTLNPSLRSLKILSQNLKEIKNFVSIQETLPQQEESFFVFKKVFPLSIEKKLKRFLIKPKFAFISPYRLSNSMPDSELLLTGDCQSPKLNNLFSDFIANQSWQPYFSSPCGLSEKVNYGLAASEKFVKDNKSVFIWSAVAVGAIYFLKTTQYRSQH